MGEVWRARDTRLGREVAIKVLPADVASDPERLKRFEKEARSASALNHPNIVTLHDTGTTDGVSWIAMEHVEGETLRRLLVGGPLPVKRLLRITTQIAEGLAKAHEAGIIHRDLKPENVMVTKDGLVKILDFGLAKLSGPVSSKDEDSKLPTMTGTSPGIILGTVGYMSPEQASGKPVDFRSDHFSFGSILYEVATGRRAFQRKTAVDTLSAILNEEPDPIAKVSPQTPAPLRWIVERCLAKEPRQRYSATDDLARDLENVRDHLSEFSGGIATLGVARPSRVPRILALLAMVALVAAGFLAATLRSRPATVPHFERVTFQQGGMWRARFAPDGQTIVYAMTGIGNDSKPVELFSTRAGNLDSRSLGLPPADIFSISRSGQLAIGLARDPLTQEAATLAEASLAGGTPRPILESVVSADWSRDGKTLAVVHASGGRNRIEYPIGKVLYESTFGLLEPRISPDSTLVAFSEDQERTPLKVVDREGVVHTLVNDTHGSPACWSSNGQELWWIKQPSGFVNLAQTSEVHAVTRKGSDRVVTCLPGEFSLDDMASDGRLLVENIHKSYMMSGHVAGESGERNFTWLDQSIPTGLSSDGKLLLFGDRGDTAGSTSGSYLWKTDGSAAVRLGEGSGGILSPDGKWALVCRKLPKHYLVLIPIGAGEERVLPRGLPIPDGRLVFHPDGKRIFLDAIEPGRRQRIYEESIEGGAPKPVTPEGQLLKLVSPDGTLLMARGEGERNVTLFPTDPKAGIAPRTVALQSTHDVPVHWSADGRSVLVLADNTRPFRVDRLDLASGRRTFLRSFSPGVPLGAGGLTSLVLTPNEESWVVGYQRYISELLVIDGLK